VPRAGIEPATLSLEVSCSIQLSYRGMTISVVILQKEYNRRAMRSKTAAITENITAWVGSFSSLIFHTILFIAILLIGTTRALSWDIVLLILTTGVSLEAIYLAIFIQMSVNQQSQTIKEVEQDVDEIKEDVGEIQEDIDAIEEDVDEIKEDDQEDEARDQEHRKTLEAMSINLQKLLSDIEKMKKST
jgi:methyl-accepting chemotaxis protein